MGFGIHSELKGLKEREIALLQEATRLGLLSGGARFGASLHGVLTRIREIDQELLDLLRKQVRLRERQIAQCEREARSAGALKLHQYGLEGCKRRIDELERKLAQRQRDVRQP